ncbi:hypothetical protein N7486_009719 [Penicillium sp. IBT 16267x]|nr:hypothetical protein N7486_009719 [Penicillium sp. IBT 16267x]
MLRIAPYPEAGHYIAKSSRDMVGFVFTRKKYSTARPTSAQNNGKPGIFEKCDADSVCVLTSITAYKAQGKELPRRCPGLQPWYFN